MNGKDLLEGMGYVEDRFVEEAETQILRRSPVPLNRWISAAACLLLMGGTGYALLYGFQPKRTAESAASSPLQQEICQDANSNTEGQADNQTGSVVIRIQSLTGDGFTGTVTEIVDSNQFEIGMELNVVLDGELSLEFRSESAAIAEDKMEDTQENPADTLVLIRFDSYDPETGTIYAWQIVPAEEGKDGSQ